MRLTLFFTTLFSTITAPVILAQTVIYTTPDYPVADPQPGVLVQILESIPALERSLFPQLSVKPEQAAHQARAQMQRPGWQVREARLTRAYQALLDAHTLGVKKVPAVVFDDKYVIYGTTDVRRAEQVLDMWQEQQP